MSNKSFNEEAATLIAEKLKTFTNITSADISDIIAGKPEEEALKVLKIICESLEGRVLVEVNLSDNALGSKGVHACRSVLTGKALEKLYVCNNGMAAESGELLAEILLEGGSPPLKLLHFYNNMSGNGGAVAIAKILEANPQITDLRFSATRAGNEGCLAVTKALASLQSLESVDISDNNFGDEAGEQLATSLGAMAKLHTLNLRDAGLGPENLLETMKALKNAGCPLKHLDLSGNDIDEDCMVEVVDVIRHSEGMKTVEALSFDDNEIGTQGAASFATLLSGLPQPLPNLRTVSMNTCEITASGAFKLACEVAKIMTFKTLICDGNQICARGVDEMQKVLEAAGKTLEPMEDNDDEGEDDLEDVLQRESDPFADALGEVQDAELPGLVSAMQNAKI